MTINLYVGTTAPHGHIQFQSNQGDFSSAQLV